MSKMLRKRWALALGALCLTAVLAGPLYAETAPYDGLDEPVKTVPPPEHWKRFAILVWQFQTNVLNDKALYEEVNIRGFHIDRSNSKLKAFADETKWPFYVDHAADKGYLHLGKHAGKLQKKFLGVQPRPNSLADPQTMATMKNFLKQNINASKGSTALAYAMDDEISLGSFSSPYEVDSGAKSVEGYRKFLEKMYGDIAALNKQYGSNYKDFASISPKSYEDFRGQVKPNTLGKLNLSHWCDWRSYMDTQFANVLNELTRFANEQDPTVPAGFVGGQGPTAYGGYDWRKLTRSVQWVEAYDIGGNDEFLRSLWDQKRPRMHTFFSSKDPKKDAWYLWYCLVHGNRGVICWPAGWFKGGQVASHIKANAETFKEIQGPVGEHILDGEYDFDPVAIYYSHPSVQVTWAMDSASHGKTWPNRSSSMDNGLSTNMTTRIGWLKTLEDIGIQARFVHQDHLLAGELQKLGVKVLLLNRTLCLSDAEAQAIEKFAADGGTVIADHMCGVYDEHGKARATGALDKFFGVKRDLSKGILGGNTTTEVDCEKGYRGLTEANWMDDGAPAYKDMVAFERALTADGGTAEATPGGTAVGVRNGKALYLNLATTGYNLKRSKGLAKEWPAYVADIMSKAGVTPRVKLDANGNGIFPEGLLWKNGDSHTLCVINNIARKAAVDGFGSTDTGVGDGSVKVKITFAKAVKGLKNVRTGKDLGDGASFEDDWTPWEGNVYTFTR